MRTQMPGTPRSGQTLAVSTAVGGALGGLTAGSAMAPLAGLMSSGRIRNAAYSSRLLGAQSLLLGSVHCASRQGQQAAGRQKIWIRVERSQSGNRQRQSASANRLAGQSFWISYGFNVGTLQVSVEPSRWIAQIIEEFGGESVAGVRSVKGPHQAEGSFYVEVTVPGQPKRVVLTQVAEWLTEVRILDDETVDLDRAAAIRYLRFRRTGSDHQDAVLMA